ncbi:MAG: signal peptidase I, partial [Brevundimonas sp.]
MTAHTSPATKGRASRAVGSVAFTAIVLAVAAFLWPAAWGGSTSLVIVSGHSMDGTYATGDLVVARTGEPKVGDVVVYQPDDLQGHIVHRIVGGDADGWVMQGDNNEWQDPFKPTNDEIDGVVKWHVGGVNWLTTLLRAPTAWICLIVIALGLFLWPSRRVEVDEDEENPESSAHDADTDE